MTLSLYLARRFLRSWLMVFAVFASLMFVIDMVEQLRQLGDHGLGFAGAAGLAALNVPSLLYNILPLITLIGSVALFVGLARSSELVAIRAAGRSAFRMLAAPAVTAALLGGVTVAFLNPLTTGATKKYERIKQEYRTGETRAVSVSAEGLWLRQGGAGGQSVIHAGHANDDGTELGAATFLLFAPDGAPLRRVQAERARLAGGQWLLEGVKDWPIATSDNPERDAVGLATLALPSDLTPDEIREGVGQQGQISVWALPAYIERLTRAGFSAQRHVTWLQFELALPLLFAAMVLLASGFTMRHARFGRTGVMVLMAIGAGLGFFFLKNFALVLGENGQIPAALAAWSTPTAAVLAALGLILHMEST